jgi:hypothetical protein
MFKIKRKKKGAVFSLFLFLTHMTGAGVTSGTNKERNDPRLGVNPPLPVPVP